MNEDEMKVALLAEAAGIRAKFRESIDEAERKRLAAKYRQIDIELQILKATEAHAGAWGRCEEENPLRDMVPGDLDLKTNLPSKFSLMSVVGVLLLCLGLGVAGYFMLFFDVSVEADTPSVTIMGETFGGEQYRVVNMGLLSDQRNGIIVGGVLAVVGAIFMAVGELTRRRKSP